MREAICYNNHMNFNIILRLLDFLGMALSVIFIVRVRRISRTLLGSFFCKILSPDECSI